MNQKISNTLYMEYKKEKKEKKKKKKGYYLCFLEFRDIYGK